MSRASLAFAVLILAACDSSERDGIECVQHSNCNLMPDGACLDAPSGRKWCAYPDDACESGMRYSDLDVGDGLSGECVARELPDASTVDAADPDGGVPDALDAMGGSDAGLEPLAELALRFGGGGMVHGNAVGMDGEGNIYVAGTYTSSAYFGGNNIPGQGSPALFIASYAAASGSHRWSFGFGTGTSAIATDLAVDPNGDVVLVGYFNGTLNVGGSNLVAAEGSDVFVAKFRGSTGAHLWSHQHGGDGVDSAGAVAVDSSGDVFVAASFWGTASFGGSILQSAGSWDIALAKYRGTNGSHVWSTSFGGTDNDTARSLAVTGNGDVVMGGSFRSPTISLGGATLSTAGLADGFVAKYTGATGSHEWSFAFGSSQNDTVNAVAIAPDDSVYIGATFRGTINVGGNDLTSQGADDAMVARFASNGSHLWSRRYGGTLSDGAVAVEAVASGGVAVAGIFNPSINLGGGNLVSNGGADVFVAELAANGDHVWSTSFGGPETEGVGAIAVRNGDILVIGYFLDSMEVLGNILSSAGNMDMYLVRFAP